MKPDPCILSLGSVNLDFQVRVERWPEPGETLSADDFIAVGGGKAANVAFCSRRLGVPAMLLARIGGDAFGAMAIRSLRDAGVDLRRIIHTARQPTGVALIAVRPDGDKTIVLAANANAQWTEEDATAAQAAVSEAAPGSVLVADLEVPPQVVRRIARACREKGFTTVLDPSPVSRMAPDLYSLFDCITPNAGEAAALVGFPVRSEEDGLRAGKTLRDRGIANVFAKLAHGGCALVCQSGAHVLSAPKVAVVDKTGAGDAFAAALAVGILRKQAIAEAARLAVAASTASVTRYGSQASSPDWAQLERLLPCVAIAGAPHSGRAPRAGTGRAAPA